MNSHPLASHQGQIYSHSRRLFTYLNQVGLRIVFLPSVNIIVDCDETRASATAKLVLHSKDCDSVLGGLELLGHSSLDVSLLNAGLLGVNELNSLEERGGKD